MVADKGVLYDVKSLARRESDRIHKPRGADRTGGSGPDFSRRYNTHRALYTEGPVCVPEHKIPYLLMTCACTCPCVCACSACVMRVRDVRG